MAAVMCAAVVTTSAAADGRARQLSRRVGAQSCDTSTSRPRDRGGQCCHFHRRDGRRGRSHIAGNYLTGAWHFYDFLSEDHDRPTAKWPSALVRYAELGLC
jgi:hypothetical protein